MLYLTGDIHGDLRRLAPLAFLEKGDSLIIAGDFGCVWGTPGDAQRLALLASLPYQVLFADGNHECFPKLNAFPEEEWHSGRVHRLCPNVLHLMRGQVYELDGFTLFTMGGGFSIDHKLRTPGKDWWPGEELPSSAEYAEAWTNLRKHGYRADLLLSHAAPLDSMCSLMERGILQVRYAEEQELNEFLQVVRSRVEFQHHYFGHLHFDLRADEKTTAVYHGVYRLPDGKRM